MLNGTAPILDEGSPQYLRLRQRLWRAKLRLGSYRALGRKLDVNLGYLQPFVVHGREPVNPDVRSKLGLPAYPRRPKQPRPKKGLWYWENFLRWHK